ncbi:TonB-dependent receptor [Mucilaginibacter sp. dw_454]|uniref:TonB-dependent receptor n=1 Tax=Mucilaginibacter sp. dw_454 TaxID=2720079 RepID=UPI001BD2E5AF|nr:TonB-dependent receptor [Mucilaginibacter sp. dw_454]
MSKLSFSVLLLVLFSFSALAQRGSIKGLIIDSVSKAPIEHATIAVVNSKDTSLVSYTLSQKDGSFKLTSLPIDISNRVVISIMQYGTFRKTLKLQSNVITDLGQISLNPRSLKEIVIKGERTAVAVKKDTIEFTAEAFKTRPNAVVEDLLRLLPGVQVNADGSIMFNGKSVNRLLIDGKRFFGNDTKVATKNLDADMLDKIQIYDDREDDPDHRLSDREVGKVINLKMKSKIKRSTLGKVYGGVGTRDRHEIGGILSNFRDTLQVSLIGLSNNLNSTGFSNDELYTMGGFGRSQGGQVNDGTFGGQNWGGGIQSVISGGVNINNDYGTKLRMNLTYFYTGTNTLYNAKNEVLQTTDQTVIDNKGEGTANYDSRKQALTAAIDWKPDTNMRILYTPNFSFQTNPSSYIYTGNSANLQGSINFSNSSQTSNSSGNNFNHNFMFYRKLGHKGTSITVNHSLTLSHDSPYNYSLQDIRSFVSSVPSQLLDRHEDDGSVNNTFGLTVGFYHPITKKIIVELNTNTRYLVIAGRANVFEKNPGSGQYSLFNDTLSKNLVRHWFVQNIKPIFTYKFTDDINIKAAIDLEIQNVTNFFNIDTVRNINKKYQLLFPSFELNIKGFSARYSQSYDLPTIDDLLPTTRVYNAFYRVTGNPNLQANKVSEMHVNYYHYYNDKQVGFNFYGNLYLADNVRITKTTIDSVGVNSSTTLNEGSSVRSDFGFGFSKQFKQRQKWQINFNTNFNGDIRRSDFILNTDKGTQTNYNFSASPTVNFNYSSLLSFNTNYQFGIQSTQYKGVNYAAVNLLTHTVGTDLSLSWPAHFIFDAKYSYNYRPQVGQGFQQSSNIVDLATTFMFLKKDRGQFKLSVYDLFDQNVSIYRYASNNSLITSEQQILRRYFMLTFQYKLSSYK